MAKHIRGGPPLNNSEKWAVEFLQKNLPENYLLISNIDITDSYGKRLEVDALLIGEWAVYVLEFKGYTGTVRAGEQVWDLGNGLREHSPIGPTGYKARVLAGRLRRRVTGSMHVPWCQATVFVTGARGQNIELKRDRNAGSVHGPADILPALTTSEGLTAHYRNRLTPQQREFVLHVLGEVGRLSEVSNRLQGFDLGEVLLKSGAVKVQRATFRHGEFEREFLLRILDRSAFRNADECAARCQRLADEFRLYQELSDVAGVPYVAPLIDDGEILAMPIAKPMGKVFSTISPEELDPSERTGILESVARVLSRVHARGAVHGALDADSIIVAVNYQVELLDFSAGHVDVNEHSPPELRNGDVAGPATDIHALGVIFNSWFQPGASENASSQEPQWSSRLEAIGQWLEEARREDPESRPALQELLDMLADRVVEQPATGAAEARIEPGGDPDGTGTYLLDAALGGAGKTEVWRATQMHGYYPCALQMTTVDSDEEGPVLARFRSLSSLAHPALARPLDIRRSPDGEWMLMATQWIEGQSLDQLIESGEVIELESSLDWLRQLLTGLQYCHGRQLVHRNIAPATIVVNEDQAALVEFQMRPDGVHHETAMPYVHPHAAGVDWTPEFDLYGLAGAFLKLWTGSAPRDASGRTLPLDEILQGKGDKLPASVRDGLCRLLDPAWKLEDETSYLAMFGLEPPKPRLRELPAALRQKWKISRGHQEKLVCFALRDRTSPDKPRTRSRQQLATLTLRADRTTANASNVGSAKAQISNLLKQGVLEKRGRQSVALTDEFLNNARRYVG